MDNNCGTCTYYKEIVKRKPAAQSYGRCTAARYFTLHVYASDKVCIFNKYTPTEE
mgnify:CR=1 FL=1